MKKQIGRNLLYIFYIFQYCLSTYEESAHFLMHTTFLQFWLKKGRIRILESKYLRIRADPDPQHWTKTWECWDSLSSYFSVEILSVEMLPNQTTKLVNLCLPASELIEGFHNWEVSFDGERYSQVHWTHHGCLKRNAIYF